MGLSVAQVRLLSLTNRKSDIELQMQLNAKRKQMLTRKSTELAQQYYNRLQNYSIQYATTNGYEDVDYNYLMGETDTSGSGYTKEFLAHVAGDGNLDWGKLSDYTPTKCDKNMILVNQYGEVVANESITTAMAKAKSNAGTSDAVTQSAYAILQLVIDACKTSTVATRPANLERLFKLLTVSDTNEAIDSTKLSKFAGYLKGIIEHGCGSETVDIYQHENDTSKYYKTKEDAQSQKNPITLENGVIYHRWKETWNSTTSKWVTNTVANNTLYYNGWATDLNGANIERLTNLASYFAPIFSAAIQNGVAATPTQSTRSGGDLYEITYNTSGGVSSSKQYDGTDTSQLKAAGGCPIPSTTFNTLDPSGAWTDMDIKTCLNNASISNSIAPCSFIITDPAGNKHYINIRKASGTGCAFDAVDPNLLGSDFYEYRVKQDKRGNFVDAKTTANLQAGLKSGTYQLCMVDDVVHGIYKKNTTLAYYTNKSYVLKRTDTSVKEEITAWFNTEQAKISEKETYWDAEIQNLSTELTSVNAEIESVKQLKSNAIKSVFSWGNS